MMVFLGGGGIGGGYPALGFPLYFYKWSSVPRWAFRADPYKWSYNEPVQGGPRSSYKWGYNSFK